MCAYATVLLTILFLGEIEDKRLWQVTFFDRSSGEEFQADYYVVFQYLFHRHLFEAGMLVITGVMTLALVGFLSYHGYITSIGMTTNEHFKWGDVKRWHKEEVKKYKKYLKQENQQENKSADDNSKKKNINNFDAPPEKSDNKNGKSSNKPHISDGDVNCTGGKASKADKDAKEKAAASFSEQEDEEEVVQDPGPMPKNIYNRGFVENWKDVLFPQSLQRREAAKAGVRKPKST